MTNKDLDDWRQILNAALRNGEDIRSPQYRIAQATIWCLLEGLRSVMHERGCLPPIKGKKI